MRDKRTSYSACMCYGCAWTFCMDEEVCLLLLAMEGSFKLVLFPQDASGFSGHHVTMWQWMEFVLRQRDNSWSLDCHFVAVDGICCREMLVGGTASMHVRDPCSPTQYFAWKCCFRLYNKFFSLSAYQRTRVHIYKIYKQPCRLNIVLLTGWLILE